MTAPATTRPDGTQIWEGNTERLERRIENLERRLLHAEERLARHIEYQRLRSQPIGGKRR